MGRDFQEVGSMIVFPNPMSSYPKSETNLSIPVKSDIIVIYVKLLYAEKRRKEVPFSQENPLTGPNSQYIEEKVPVN